MIGIALHHHRPHLRRRVEAMPKANPARVGNDALKHPIKDFLMHVESGARHAHLATVEKDRIRDTRDGELQIRIRQHDRRRLAAEFKRQLLEVAASRLEHQLADFGRTCERDLIDAGMRSQCGTGAFAESGHDI